MKLNKLSFVLIGASLFLISSPAFASELDQQIKQNQTQLTQAHQQEQDYIKQKEAEKQARKANKGKRKNRKIIHEEKE